MSALRGIAAIMAGMGTGLVAGKEAAEKKARQDKDDAWQEEQRNRQRSEWSEKDALKTSMKDAFADRSTIEGTAVTGTTGTNLYKDPGQAQAMAEEARIEAEMRGESPSAVATTQATGITGGMSKGHQITTGPVDLNAINSRDAKMARGVNALMAAGDPEKAISMENVVMQNKAQKLGLDAAQLKFADDQFNRKLQETLSRGGDFWGNASQVLTDTSVGGLAGVQVKPVVSADGKTVQLVGVKNGQEKVMFSAPNTTEGRLAFVQETSKADPVTKISWLKEGVDREAEKTKRAEDQANKDRDFGLRKQESESNQSYRSRMLKLQEAQDGRQAETHRVTMEAEKLPAAVKLSAASLNKQIESVATALNKAMAEGQFDPNNPGTAQLLKQQADLGVQYHKLIQPYLPSKAGSTGLPDASVFDAPKTPASQPPSAATAKPAQPVAPPSAPPPQQARAPLTTMQAMNPSGNASLESVLGPKSTQIQGMAEMFRQAQQKTAEAAKAGNPTAVVAAAQAQQQVRGLIDKALQDMNPQQAQAVRQAVGIN